MEIQPPFLEILQKELKLLMHYSNKELPAQEEAEIFLKVSFMEHITIKSVLTLK